MLQSNSVTKCYDNVAFAGNERSCRSSDAFEDPRHRHWRMTRHLINCTKRSSISNYAPLPRIINGRSAFAKSEIAPVTDFAWQYAGDDFNFNNRLTLRLFPSSRPGYLLATKITPPDDPILRPDSACQCKIRG